MLQHPIYDADVSKWKREACEALRIHLCSHNDERLRQIQRDQHNRVCDVYNDKHQIAYFHQLIHSATMISNVFKLFGTDDVNVSRGIRVNVHSQFD